MKLVSIVIANYNYGCFLEEAIKSVITQEGFDNCELIICDAASTDNSVDVIKKYADKLTWWCSEKDGGQSAAFNKGFSHSEGRFLTWLNADDIMLPGTVVALKVASDLHPNAEWFCGNFLRFREDTGEIIEAAWGPHWVPKCMQGNGFPPQTFGPTTFWSRKLYDAVGPLDESLHYIMDSEYWERLVMAGYKYLRIKHCCWAFRMHVDSKTAEFGSHKRSEKVYNVMQEERRYKGEKTGHHVSTFGKYLIWGMRILDGSAAIALWRRLFVVGKKFE